MNIFRIPKPIRKVSKTCSVCGMSFVPSKHASGRFCSPKCWYATRTKSKGRSCRQCGNVFANKNPLRYCSRECFLAKSKKAKVRICEQCKSEFTVERPCLSRKYCCKKCEGIGRRLQPFTFTCPQCRQSKTLPRVTSRPRKFCSLKCASQYKREENSSNWRGGNNRAYRGPTWPSSARAARARDGHICQGCLETGNQRLSVDHIVPFRLAKVYSDENGIDPNTLVNLISLCRSCHGKKATAELALLRGDISKFVREAKVLIPLEKIEAALQLWGLVRKAA